MNNTDKVKPRLTMAIFCAIAFSVMELVLTPLYIYLYSDITVSVTVLPNIAEIILELAEIFTFAVCYSLVIYCAVVKGGMSVVSLCSVYVLSTLIRRAVSLGISYLSYGFVEKSDIFNVSVYLAFEIIQITVVALIASLVGQKHRGLIAEKEKAARIIGDSSAIPKIEFKKIFSKENPLLVCALASGIMLSAVNVGMRIFYDISYGAPSGIDEILTMIVYYLSDVLTAVIFYALSWIILSKTMKKDTVS